MILYVIMIYALVQLALAFGIGILVEPRMGLHSTSWLLAAAAGFLGGMIVRRWLPAGLWIGLLTAMFAFGGFRSAIVAPPPDWLGRRVPVLTELTGTVDAYPDVGLADVRFDMRLPQLPGRVRVYWDTEHPVGSVHLGDEVRIRGAARLPEAFEGFDYPSYLERRGIVAIFYADELVTVSTARTPLSEFLRFGDRMRQRLLSRLRDAMEPEVAALAQSLLFGDRSALDTETEAAFSETGLMHLLAVSGLHLGIFLGLAWWVLRRLGVRPRFAYPLIGGLVLLALWIVGPRVSLIRAGLLFAFLGLGSVLADLGWILRRWICPLNGVASAAIVLLAIQPGAIHDAGFQLTFAATASILVAFQREFGWASRSILRLDGRWRSRAFQSLFRLIAVAAAAQAGVLPVIAWHFGAVHPLSIPLNLVAVPLAALSLWAGLLSLVFSWSAWLSWIARPFGWLLEGLRGLAKGVASLPYSEILVDPGLAIWFAGFVGFLLLILAYRELSMSLSDEE